MHLLELTGMKKAGKQLRGEKTNEVQAVGRFSSALFDLGWRLAAVVFLFLVGGSWLDKKFGTEPLFTLLGLALIVISAVLIVRRALQQIPREFGGLKDD